MQCTMNTNATLKAGSWSRSWSSRKRIINHCQTSMPRVNICQQLRKCAVIEMWFENLLSFRLYKGISISSLPLCLVWIKTSLWPNTLGVLLCYVNEEVGECQHWLKLKIQRGGGALIVWSDLPSQTICFTLCVLIYHLFAAVIKHLSGTVKVGLLVFSVFYNGRK